MFLRLKFLLKCLEAKLKASKVTFLLILKENAPTLSVQQNDCKTFFTRAVKLEAVNHYCLPDASNYLRFAFKMFKNEPRKNTGSSSASTQWAQSLYGAFGRILCCTQATLRNMQSNDTLMCTGVAPDGGKAV